MPSLNNSVIALTTTGASVVEGVVHGCDRAGGTGISVPSNGGEGLKVSVAANAPDTNAMKKIHRFMGLSLGLACAELLRARGQSPLVIEVEKIVLVPVWGSHHDLVESIEPGVESA